MRLVALLDFVLVASIAIDMMVGGQLFSGLMVCCLGTWLIVFLIKHIEGKGDAPCS